MLYNNDINNHGGLLNYYNSKIKNRKKLIKEINNFSVNNKVAEAGCGTGVLSVKLSTMGNQVYAVDESEEMLEIVDKLAILENTKVKLIKKDIFKIDKSDFSSKLDVIFSVGVYEHFSDNQIINLTKLQMQLANYVFIAIPTKYFNENEKLYGNERFLSNKKWKSLISEANGKIVKEFSCNNQSFGKIILNYKKWFKPSPIKVYIVKEN